MASGAECISEMLCIEGVAKQCQLPNTLPVLFSRWVRGGFRDLGLWMRVDAQCGFRVFVALLLLDKSNATVGTR